MSQITTLVPVWSPDHLVLENHLWLKSYLKTKALVLWLSTLLTSVPKTWSKVSLRNFASPPQWSTLWNKMLKPVLPKKNNVRKKKLITKQSSLWMNVMGVRPVTEVELLRWSKLLRIRGCQLSVLLMIIVQGKLFLCLIIVTILNFKNLEHLISLSGLEW